MNSKMKRQYIMIERTEWIRKNKYRIMIYVIALVGLIFMWLYAGRRSLWMDDIVQIDICEQENMIRALLGHDNNPPLSHFVTYLWLRVAPYGTNWMKLPSIIFVTIGAVFLAETGRHLYGDLCGLIICAFAVSSSGIVELAAYVVRPYGLLFGLMSVVLYFYVQRNLYEFQWSRIIVLGIGMTAAVYTHYFAVLALIAMFCFDCYLIAKKKINWKNLISYLIAGGAFLPWFIYTAAKYYKKMKTFFPSVPVLYDVVNTVQRLLANNKLSFSIFIIIIVGMILSGIQKKEFEICAAMAHSFLYQIIIVLMIPFIYSKWINPEGSIWVDRYFVTIAPCIFLIMGIGVSCICDYLNSRLQIKALLDVLCVALCISALYNNFYSIYISQSNPYEPYEEMADYIMSQEDIYNENVAVYNTGYTMQQGWDYYLTHNGGREGKECFFKNEINNIDVLSGIERVYVCKLHRDISPVTDEILGTYFKLTYVDSETGVLVYDRIQ